MNITVELLHTMLEKSIPNLPNEPDVNLMEAGILDSMAVIELIENLENAYSIKFEDSDIDIENLSTLNNILSCINNMIERQEL